MVFCRLRRGLLVVPALEGNVHLARCAAEVINSACCLKLAVLRGKRDLPIDAPARRPETISKRDGGQRHGSQAGVRTPGRIYEHSGRSGLAIHGSGYLKPTMNIWQGVILSSDAAGTADTPRRRWETPDTPGISPERSGALARPGPGRGSRWPPRDRAGCIPNARSNSGTE